MKSAPLILVIPSSAAHGIEFSDRSLSLSARYSQAIVAAGGLPWVLPVSPDPALATEAVRRCDGVMLTGGDDVQPGLYQRTLPAGLRRTLSPASPERDLQELLVIEEVFRRGRPLLAICRGQQILNVALGGDLFVDLPAQHPGGLNHSRADRKDRLVHEAVLLPGSLLARVFGRCRIGVNSSHHQAVDRVAAPLRATARSPDGVIEGLELQPRHAGFLPYLLAVQFHPERLFTAYPEFLTLFGSFVCACGAFRGQSL